ncbi:MFS transporter [Streptomyces sp. CB03234]|uniref:MFS transporter n=1 Tax=Streptomyces sp. (strain CB03234) TaxID=1703937 RepID=UPI003FD0DA9C
MPLGLFRSTTVAVAVAAGSAASVAFYGMVFVFSLFFQQVRGLSPLGARLMSLPMTGLLAAVNVLSAKVAARHGARLPIVAGQVVAITGMLLLPLYVDDATPLALVAVLLVPLALGCGLALPPLIAAMMEAVPAERAGTAAGLLNAVRQTAGALSIAVFGSLVAGGFVHGMRVSLVLSVVLMTLTALASTRLAPGSGTGRERSGTGRGPSGTGRGPSGTGREAWVRNRRAGRPASSGGTRSGRR